ncbi:Zn-ribbon domain-containing OB-fold protein [Celeribacter sp.]|uniref:Zn-ribbon domain-containing OB-fold protein n=1 Tax=Celeribacter sp. TaxID=1890673 RepID=UPI003A9295B0
MSEDKALTVDLKLSLGYHHGFGAMSPFFRALQHGQALGSCCPKCGDARFPPRHLCLHDRTPTEPKHLDGTGKIIRVTVGSIPIPLATPTQEQAFAEIVIDGTNNRVLARLSGNPARFCPGSKVRLVPPQNAVPHPIQLLVFEPY